MNDEDAPTTVKIEPPTAPGWYAYSGGNGNIMFSLSHSGQWYAFFSNGDGGACNWGYIEQALGVYDLIKVLPSNC